MVVTDHPSSSGLHTALPANVHALPPHLRPRISIQPHAWGSFCDAFAQTHAHAFTRILAADTLWLSSQHDALLQSMAYFLKWGVRAAVWVVAGLHTGRGKVAEFLEKVSGVGLVVNEAWEVDVDGDFRKWRDVREKENGDRGKWCVVATLGWAIEAEKDEEQNEGGNGKEVNVDRAADPSPTDKPS